MAMMKLKAEPAPAGWRILLKIQDIPEVTSGGIVLPDSVRDVAGQAAQVAQVMSLGEEAYTGERIKGVWCQKGDWVLISKFAGVRVDVCGEEYRIINDDEVIAVTIDPSY